MFQKVTYFIHQYLKYFSFELIFFISSLIYLALLNPSEAEHYHFCLIKILGIGYCPGCGLGRSISYLMHGNILASLTEHPFGIIGFIIILNRIYEIIKKKKLLYKEFYG